ncbi:glycosyltransferase [Francisellaceae bacterium]|nr:glycosyltransferase [Francisellaceae bacterium]
MIKKIRVVILGLDTFKHKNISQIKLMNQSGYYFTVFTNDRMGDSKKQFGDLLQINSLKVLKGKFLQRLCQVFQYLRKSKNTLHHVELYPIGRFSIFYIIICKTLRIKSLSILRGIALKPENFDNESWLYKLSVKYSFRWSDYVWYKEPYMEHNLNRIGVTRKAFLPNAVAMPDQQGNIVKSIDFIWVNRIIKERYFDWVTEHFYNHRNSSLTVLGSQGERDFMSSNSYQLLNKMKDRKEIDFQGFVNPMAYYQLATYFILPTEIVFGNYALLEAMSYGVIPIVSSTDSTSLIVQDGVNGLVFNNDKASFFRMLKYAVNLSEEKKKLLSEKAQETIHQQYSLDSHKKSLLKLYSKLD